MQGVELGGSPCHIDGIFVMMFVYLVLQSCVDIVTTGGGRISIVEGSCTVISQSLEKLFFFRRESMDNCVQRLCHSVSGSVHGSVILKEPGPRASSKLDLVAFSFQLSKNLLA